MTIEQYLTKMESQLEGALSENLKKYIHFIEIHKESLKFNKIHKLLKIKKDRLGMQKMVIQF